MKTQKEIEKGCKIKIKDVYMHGEKFKLNCGNEILDSVKLCPTCQALLQQSKEFVEMIENIDIELFLTDIKDKKGNKFEFSDELMEIIRIWWEQKLQQLKSSLIGSEEK